MFYLDSWVDFKEDESTAGNQEFNGCQPAVVSACAQPRRGLVQFTPPRLGKALSGRDFDELLVAPLDAAVTVAERQRTRRGARRCRDDLHLDVSRVGQMRLGEHRPIAESKLGLGGALPVGIVNLIDAADYSHAAAAAAGQRLDHDAAVLRGGERVNVLDAAGPVGGRQHRHIGRGCGTTGLRLVAEKLQRRGVRPDERIPSCSTSAREFGLFAQEPVAGMDQLRTRLLGCRQDRGVIQVSGRPGAGQTDRFVSRMHVRAVGIVLGVNGDRAEPQLDCGADDPKRDLTAVRDQQARHVPSFVRSAISHPDHIMPLLPFVTFTGWSRQRQQTPPGQAVASVHQALHRGRTGCRGDGGRADNRGTPGECRMPGSWMGGAPACADVRQSRRS